MSVNKSIAVLTVAAVLVGTLAAGITIHWWLAEPAVWLFSTSANHKYTVELTGDKGRGGILIPSVVNYNILVDGNPLTRERLAHSGDAMDISFEIAYQNMLGSTTTLYGFGAIGTVEKTTWIHS